MRNDSAVRILAGLAALSALSAPAGAGAAEPRAMIRLHAQGQASPPAGIADLAWIEGHWLGHMPGFVRALSPQGPVFYEISVFVEIAGSLSVRVKHFTPSFVGWEARDAYIDRRLVGREGDTFYFDGITFERTGPDSFTVYFLDRADGRERATLVIPFRREA